MNSNSYNREEKRNVILNYVKNIYHKEQRYVSKREIRKKFHFELYNYFRNMFDLYQNLGIEITLAYCPKEYAKMKIIEYVRQRVAEGHFPGRIEIDAKLKIHVYTYFNSMKDVYREANIDYSLHLSQVKKNRFHSRKKINEEKNKIIDYIRQRKKENYHVGVREIQNNLNISFYKYFTSLQEAYKKAGKDYQRSSPIFLGKKKEADLTKVILHLLVEWDIQLRGFQFSTINYLTEVPT